MNAKKIVAALLAVVLLIGIGVGGTLAWLMDTTLTVKNTFTVGEVTITLKESPLNDNGSYGTPAEGTANAYQLIPGKKYTKDPTVAVDATSEDCWLFVKFEENGNAAQYITYTSTLNEGNGWTQGDGTVIPADVWYREVKKTDTTRSWALLQGNEITINANTVTNETMDAAKNASLNYIAYAVQKANDAASFSAEQAWDIALDGTLSTT